MDSFHDLFKPKNMGQAILAILFVIYLIMGYQTPPQISQFIDTTYGIIIVVVIALLLFAYTNPILGILGFLVAYSLITKSTYIRSQYALNQYLPTEIKRLTTMTQNNQFPYTLEQEMVKMMAPINKYESSDSKNMSFNPILDNLHGASPINSQD
jgi:hypothetical protein